MRFWEVVSAFRAWPGALGEAFAMEPWRRDYLGLYEQYNQLVDRQDREVLDSPVPIELSREIAARCPQRFAYDPASQELRCSRPGAADAVRLVEMTTLEVHDRFGGSVIEEVFEYGSTRIPRTV